MMTHNPVHRNESCDPSGHSTVRPIINQTVKTLLAPFPRLNNKVRAYRSYYAADSELPYLQYLCRPESYAIDVGAAFGAVAHWLGKYSAGVIMFEPNPYFHPLLTKCFRGPRFIMVPKAASASAGHRNLVIPRDRLGRSTIDEENQKHLQADFADLDIVDVDVVTLNDFADYPIGFVKIDVEGHEFSVLQGAEAVLSTYGPNLLIEIEERHHGGSFGQVYEYLASRYGYRCLALHQGRFIEITPSSYRRFQDPDGVYIYNFIFSADAEVCSKLITLTDRTL